MPWLYILKCADGSYYTGTTFHGSTSAHHVLLVVDFERKRASMSRANSTAGAPVFLGLVNQGQHILMAQDPFGWGPLKVFP